MIKLTLRCAAAISFFLLLYSCASTEHYGTVRFNEAPKKDKAYLFGDFKIAVSGSHLDLARGLLLSEYSSTSDPAGRGGHATTYAFVFQEDDSSFQICEIDPGRYRFTDVACETLTNMVWEPSRRYAADDIPAICAVDDGNRGALGGFEAKAGDVIYLGDFAGSSYTAATAVDASAGVYSCVVSWSLHSIKNGFLGAKDKFLGKNPAYSRLTFKSVFSE